MAMKNRHELILHCPLSPQMKQQHGFIILSSLNVAVIQGIDVR
jgi:hypothetical protein